MSNSKKLLNWEKGCFIAFSIIIGIINLILSFFLKDVIISGMTFLTYLGLTINFFKIEKKLRPSGAAEGVIDIIMIVLTIGMICFLSIKYKKSITD